MKNATVPIGLLLADPNQPRQEFFKDEMKTLEDSIKDKGIMNPIVVEPLSVGKYLVIDGERRLRASKKVGLKQVPVNIIDKALSPSERNVMRFQLQENTKEWSVLEKAQAIKNIKEELQITNDELAYALGMTGNTVRNHINLLSFAPDKKKQMVKARIPFTYLKNLSKISKQINPEIKKIVPDFLDKCIQKYEDGLIREAEDFNRIARLVKTEDHKKEVVKFFNNSNYSATDAYHDSGYTAENIISVITRSAKVLDRNLKSVKRLVMTNNSLKVMYELQKTLNEKVDNIKTSD